MNQNWLLTFSTIAGINIVAIAYRKRYIKNETFTNTCLVEENLRYALS